ncbi:MAG: DJ-1/PfpI family protein [Tissierellia bacterium]|nr:DJ-1/PfpI family protein [Tissierellia bacterium]
MVKVSVLLKNGFEEIEALTIVDYLRRADISVDMISVEEGLQVIGSHGIKIEADMVFDKVEGEKIDLVFLPGGMPGAKSLSEDQRVLSLIKSLDSRGKAIAAICAAPIVLENAGLIKGKKVTSYPSFETYLKSVGQYREDLVVVDENIITSRGPATAVLLALELIELLKGKEKMEEIKKDILFDLLKENI